MQAKTAMQANSSEFKRKPQAMHANGELTKVHANGDTSKRKAVNIPAIKHAISGNLLVVVWVVLVEELKVAGRQIVRRIK